MYSKSLRWQLIENKILEEYNIKVTEDELLDYTKTLVIAQMQQYQQPNPEEKQLVEIARNILTNEEERKKIYTQVVDKHTFTIFKENFKLKFKNISYNDFIKLASEKSK